MRKQLAAFLLGIVAVLGVASSAGIQRYQIPQRAWLSDSLDFNQKDGTNFNLLSGSEVRTPSLTVTGGIPFSVMSQTNMVIDALQTSVTNLGNIQSTGTVAAVTLTGAGGGITINASGFDGNLTTSDNTLQEIAQKVDDLATGVSGGLAPLATNNAANLTNMFSFVSFTNRVNITMLSSGTFTVITNVGPSQVLGTWLSPAAGIGSITCNVAGLLTINCAEEVDNLPQNQNTYIGFAVNGTVGDYLTFFNNANGEVPPFTADFSPLIGSAEVPVAAGDVVTVGYNSSAAATLTGATARNFRFTLRR